MYIIIVHILTLFDCTVIFFVCVCRRPPCLSNDTPGTPPACGPPPPQAGTTTPAKRCPRTTYPRMLGGVAAPMEADLRRMRTAGRGPRRRRRAQRRGGGRLSFLSGAGSGGEGKGRASSSRRRRDGPGARQEEANGTRARPGSSRSSRTAPASSKCSGPGGGPTWGRPRPEGAAAAAAAAFFLPCGAGAALRLRAALRLVASGFSLLLLLWLLFFSNVIFSFFNFLTKSWLWCEGLRALHLEGGCTKGTKGDGTIAPLSVQGSVTSPALRG